MKIFVFSDTHSIVEFIEEAIKREGNVDMLIFAGDNQCDVVSLQKLFPHLPFAYVLGNNEYTSLLKEPEVPFDRVFEVCRKRIFLTHGHRYDVKRGLFMLKMEAKENNADICIFGHTHKPFCEEQDGILMLNPGSAGLTYATLEIKDGVAEATIKDTMVRTKH